LTHDAADEEMNDAQIELATAIKRELDRISKFEELERELASPPEPSNKYSDAWWAWYKIQYTLWKREVKLQVASSAAELTQKSVYQKRCLNMIKETALYTFFYLRREDGHAIQHNSKETGLCLLEAWNCPLPMNDLGFGKEDARSMFPGINGIYLCYPENI
jgi:hypothetical protein